MGGEEKRERGRASKAMEWEKSGEMAGKTCGNCKSAEASLSFREEPFRSPPPPLMHLQMGAKSAR